MSTLSPRLQVRVQQKQTLTPGLVQMVSLLQLNRLELKDMISVEISRNPVLEEATEGTEELTPEELQPLLEAEAERNGEHPDQSILDATVSRAEIERADGVEAAETAAEAEAPEAEIPAVLPSSPTDPPLNPEVPEAAAANDPFEEIDLGDYFDNYLDPGFKSPATEDVE